VRWRWHARSGNEAADALVRQLLWPCASAIGVGSIAQPRPNTRTGRGTRRAVATTMRSRKRGPRSPAAAG